MVEEKFNLCWNKFENSVSETVRKLYTDKNFTDVTLVCEDGKQIAAHKVILSTSLFFNNILIQNPHDRPLLYLKGIPFNILKSLVQFMYLGQVEVAQNDLDEFMNSAAELKVDGLQNNGAENYKYGGKESFNEDHAKVLDTEEQYQQRSELIRYFEPPIVENTLRLEEEEYPTFFRNNDGLFPCDQCPYQAKQRTHLHQHKMTRHEGARYKCDLCEKDFAQPSFIGRHKKAVHGNGFLSLINKPSF